MNQDMIHRKARARKRMSDGNGWVRLSAFVLPLAVLYLLLLLVLGPLFATPKPDLFGVQVSTLNEDSGERAQAIDTEELRAERDAMVYEAKWALGLIGLGGAALVYGLSLRSDSRREIDRLDRQVAGNPQQG
ncbi:MAG: hypothetical protein ACX94C_11795 [Phycisphaerales bacterium]